VTIEANDLSPVTSSGRAAADRRSGSRTIAAQSDLPDVDARLTQYRRTAGTSAHMDHWLQLER
jgi:hypothetical protein